MCRKRGHKAAAKLSEAGWVIAPALYIPEVANVFWKYYQFRDTPVDRCEMAVRNAASVL